MGKRIISVILVILLCLNMLPFNVAAAEEKALASQREAVSAEEDPTEKERVPASPSEAVPERKEEKDPPVKEKIPASPSEAVPAKEEEELPAEPYYLFLVHFLDIDGGQYASSELVELEPDDLLDSAYDLRQNILEKEGMKAVAASLSASFRSRKPWRTTLFPST